MKTDTGALNLQWATLIVEELTRAGVRVCSLASGARSSPLAIAVARQANMTSVVHVDERGAAFFALGYARATGRPALWLTTSGSAVANGFPAVVEAASARVPLLLLTADRPPELRDTGANQTINQVNLFAGHVRWHVDLPCPSPELEPEFLLTTIDQAVHRTVASPAGPVHLNAMFREPLLPEPGVTITLPPVRGGWREGSAPYTDYRIESCPVVAQPLPPARRGLLVAGELRSAAARAAVRRLAERLQWPLLPDVTSGLRLGGGGPAACAAFDQVLLSPSARARLAPEAVLHVGGSLVSKRLAQFLEDVTPSVYVRVAEHPERVDPDHRVTHRVQADVAAWCEAQVVRVGTAGDPEWLRAWMEPAAVAERTVQGFLVAQPGLTEPGVARIVSGALPPGHGLFLASSMPVRDMDMVGDSHGPAPFVAANRGASGIDGTIATAAGFARGLGASVTVVIGDLAFLHDLNSLAFLRGDGPPVTLVVINNNGGGIFSFLPVAGHRDVFERQFGTPHGLRFEQAAALYGLPYAHPENPAQFADVYRAFSASPRSGVIEVTTDRAANLRVHEALQAAVRAALGG